MDDDLKVLIESTATETRRHFDIVADGLRHEIRLVAESVLGNTERIERLETKVDGLQVQGEALAAKVDGLNAKVDAVAAKVDGLESDMKAEFVEVHARIDRLEPPSTH